MAPTVQDTVINGQNRGESMSQQQSSIASTLTPRNNTHPPPLHPHNDSSQPSISPFGHSSVTEIVLIVGGALIICVLGVIALAIMRSTILKKTLRLLSACGPRHTNNTGKSKSMTDDKGSIVQCDDFDTLTLGTATRFVYVEGLQADLEDRPISTVPFHPGESVSPSMSSGKVFRPKPQVSLFSDGIQCPLEGEENSHDIAFAPVQALSDAFPASVVTTNLRDKEENSSLNYLGKSTLSHAGIATPGRWAFGSRSSNDYAASVSSPETPASICDSVGSFSIASSKQSLTCLSSLESTECDLDEDVVFEFRRAQAQSLELKKGVLVTCGSRFGDDADASIDSLPTLIISGAAPNLLDDQNLAHWFSANNSLPSMRSHPVFGEAPSWSSIVRQQSSGTISLLASVSTKHIEQWCPEDTQYLHPSIPILMLTRPSDSSLRTAESFASSVSLDLCDFPFPPEPASGLCVYNSKLVDRAQHAPNMIEWNNHSIDSSVAEKRTTVERFFSMYSR